MVCIVCSTPKSPDKSRFKLHTMAKNGVQDSVHGVQGSVQRTTERTNRHDLPSPCRIPSVRPPTSDCRPQGGHPCIERMRDAHGRSNTLRPLQRRFKARKKPEGYTSTPTGLKRLKTQNTASYDCNTKWERPYLALPNLYTSANSFRKKNSSTLPTLALLNENEPLSKKRSKKARFYAGFHQFLVQKMLTEQK